MNDAGGLDDGDGFADRTGNRPDALERQLAVFVKFFRQGAPFKPRHHEIGDAVGCLATVIRFDDVWVADLGQQRRFAVKT